MAREVAADVVEEGLRLVQYGIDLVLLAPLEGGLPPHQGVLLVPAERPDVPRRDLRLELQRGGGRAVHRLGGLLVLCVRVGVVFFDTQDSGE